MHISIVAWLRRRARSSVSWRESGQLVGRTVLFGRYSGVPLTTVAASQRERPSRPGGGRRCSSRYSAADLGSVPSTQACAGASFIPPGSTPMTTSRGVPRAAIQACSTNARSRHVGASRRRTAFTPRPARGLTRGGEGTLAPRPFFLRRRRTSRTATAAHNAPTRTAGCNLGKGGACPSTIGCSGRGLKALLLAQVPVAVGAISHFEVTLEPTRAT
jgi:hypothetical protein